MKSRILALLLIFSMLPFSALAAENGVELVCKDANLYAALTDALNGVAAYDADPNAQRNWTSPTTRPLRTCRRCPR